MIQPNMQFWRQLPFEGQEVIYQLPEFPQQFNGLRDQLERQIRDELQRGCNVSIPRVMLYNQMSAGNYANQDWFLLVTSVGQLLEVDTTIYNLQLTHENVQAVIGRVVNVFLVRLFEHDPNVRNYMSQSELIAMGNLQRERNQILQAVETFYSRKNQPQPQVQYQPQQVQQNYNQLAGQGSWGQGSIYQQQVNHGPAEIPMRRTASLETTNTQPNAMQNAYSQAVETVVAKQYPRADDFIKPRIPGNSIYDSVTSTPKQTQLPGVVESLTLRPDGSATYQNGGTDVGFDQFFTRPDEPAYDPRQPEEQMAVPDSVVMVDGERRPMIDVCGIARPLVYKKYQHKITENGEIVMEYKDHELDQSVLTEEPTLRTLPIYPNAAELETQTAEVPEIAHLDGAKIQRLPEPLFNMELDTAFQYVDFVTGAHTNQNVVHFVNTTHDSVLLGDRDEFLERFKGLVVNTAEGDFSKLVQLIRDTESYSYALFRKLDRRATVATNEVLEKQLGLSFTITSFVEDFPDLPAYLNGPKYGPAWLTRFQNSLGTIHSAICCLLDSDLSEALLERSATITQRTVPAGLWWDPTNRIYTIPTTEQLETMAAEKQALEEELPLAGGLVQLLSTDYCVLVPVEYQKLGLALKPHEVAIVAPSVTPELADFINEAITGAGESHSFRRILLGTPDGVVLQLHQTQGHDVDGRTLWAVEEILR